MRIAPALMSLVCALGSAAQTPPPAALQVSAGGAANGTWSADEYFSGGNTDSTSSSINTLLDSRPAPQSVYQSERWGDMTYTMPGLTPNAPYTVNLHFAEIYFDSVGAREFNVLINGTQVLTNFDIFAATGGENMAILKSFPATANSSGQIFVQFTTGAANNPKISGIEILPVSTLLTSGGIYTLVSKTSGLLLDNDGSTTAGNDVWQWSAGAGNTNQQWQINLLPNGYYNLIDLTSGMALDNGGSTTEGTWFTQYNSSTANANQELTITSLGDGYYQLVVASSGMALDNSGATSNGGEVHQWPVEAGNSNQEWQLVPVQIGANTPFTSYEAESGTLGGDATVVSLTSPPTTEFSSPQLEASGHAYVHLASTGDSVTWTNNTGQNITYLNVRYSIPDSSGGGGVTSTLDLYIDGTYRQSIPVNSIQTWVYESSSDYDGMNQSPSSGDPHVFWDEQQVTISGAYITPGQTITLEKDSANSAAYYNIDVIDLENPPAALTQPANSLSITTNCGAVASTTQTNGAAASGAVDSTAAIQNCINTAQSSGQIVWIPQGTFYLSSAAGTGLTASGVTIEGAGMWYSTIYYNPTLPATTTSNPLSTTSTTLQNFAIDGNAVSESTAGGNGGATYVNGSNWVINSLWIRHEGAGVWASGTGGIVENNRITNSWADGININNGNGGTGYTVGNNLTVKNNFVRGSGDDGIAINDSEDNSDQSEMTSPTVLNNTVVAPWWANLLGIYGGEDDLVANNYVHDSVKGNGIYIGGYDSTGKGAPLETANVQGNVLLRGGSFGYGNQNPGIAVGYTSTQSPSGEPAMTDMYVNGNAVINSMFDGVELLGGTSTEINNNTVDSPGTGGFLINSYGEGNATFTCNTALNIPPGQTVYANDAGSNFTASGTCNVGFTIP
jgi:hypothetical protein